MHLFILVQYSMPLLLTWNTALALIFSLRWSKECAFKLPEESISPISMGEPFTHRTSLDCKGRNDHIKLIYYIYAQLKHTSSKCPLGEHYCLTALILLTKICLPVLLKRVPRNLVACIAGFSIQSLHNMQQESYAINNWWLWLRLRLC